MYLVFDLPEWESENPSAPTIAFVVHRELGLWHERYQIDYKTKFHKNRLRLIFPTDTEYTFFLMTWTPSPDVIVVGRRITLEDKWVRPRIVSPPKH